MLFVRLNTRIYLRRFGTDIRIHQLDIRINIGRQIHRRQNVVVNAMHVDGVARCSHAAGHDWRWPGICRGRALLSDASVSGSDQRHRNAVHQGGGHQGIHDLRRVQESSLLRKELSQHRMVSV